MYAKITTLVYLLSLHNNNQNKTVVNYKLVQNRKKLHEFLI